MLYDFFWVIPRRLNFIFRRFGTLCLFHLHRQVGVCFYTYLPAYEDGRQSIPKYRHIKFRHRGITQKKLYNKPWIVYKVLYGFKSESSLACVQNWKIIKLYTRKCVSKIKLGIFYPLNRLNPLTWFIRSFPKIPTQSKFHIRRSIYEQFSLSTVQRRRTEWLYKTSHKTG
jgi:hypothetical protein